MKTNVVYYSTKSQDLALNINLADVRFGDD